MKTLTHKGYARIYCETAADVSKVEDIIEEMDEFESTYLPDGMIAPFSQYPNVKYTGKFSDLDMDDLTALCWSRGIKIWVFDAGQQEWPRTRELQK